MSGGDRKALAKELTRARAMTRILTERALEKRAAGEALIREADNLACQSWKERMWAGGQDVSADVAQELRRRCDLQLRDVPFFLQDFVDRYEGRDHDVQLPLPMRLA